MSSPFIIWTMQRTGGTSLTDLLMQMSEHQTTEHEPFNWARKQPRQFWPITDAWNNTKNAEALNASLDEIFARRHLIKHCYELLSTSFNSHLLRAAARAPYRHVLLLRRDEASRLVSKFIAEAQGTWFKDYSRKVFAEVAQGDRRLEGLPVDKIVDHYYHCQSSTRFITETLDQLGVPLHRVFYEDLYVGSRESRLVHLQSLFAALDFTPADIENHKGAIDDKVFDSGQNTRSVAPYLPNLSAVLEALSEAGCPVDRSVFEVEALPPRGSRILPGPRERIATEVVQLAEANQAPAPFLEIGAGLFEDAILHHPFFAAHERHVLGTTLPEEPVSPAAAETVPVVPVAGNPNDMRPLFADGRFGTVIWNGVLTHDKFFWRTVEEIRRVLVPGGVLIVVAATFSRNADQAGIKSVGAKGNVIPESTITCKIHAAPDYWRLSPQAMREVVLERFDVKDVRVLMMPPRLFALAHNRG